VIYQPIVRKNRSFSGAISGLWTIFKTEGFFSNVVFTIGYYLTYPLLKYSSEIIFERFIQKNTSSLKANISYFALEFFLLSVRLPLNTIFKRLLVPSDKKTCVEVSSYKGGFDALNRMVREEGIGSLYVGWRYWGVFSFLKVGWNIIELQD
jgi:hypothetical protein